MFKINVGPDEQSGVAYSAMIRREGEGDSFDSFSSGGWRGNGPRQASPDAWLALVKRHLKLPAPVKKAGLSWTDAEVRPRGWSKGSGHAPQGVTITWSWLEEQNEP